ncbi:Uma2 family endonuclease [Amycolatopsis magusensis]|uniref:Uma2 family endonuclease n=1 Tax=Amycolatopsis magusensis TaxID=882444 RepID=UPI0024A945BA|nr:Uma2 family endonuclease [Amycolatopsis magusensis]MDI5976655.1 Uma2 family endonuclease [Amycolatopsis magusensis]
MSCGTWRHIRPWSVDEVLSLPEGQRSELIDGALSLKPRLEHQRMVARLLRGFAAAAPESLEVLPGANLLLGDHLLMPDLVISDDPIAEGPALRAHQVVLVAETADHGLKRSLYAQARVPFYLLVEGGEAVLHEWRDGEYHLSEKSDAGVLRLRRPFAVEVTLGG